MAHEPKISVVVPVYNEHDNIGAYLHGLWGALSAVPQGILVCYDFDEDTTLPAIAAMPDSASTPSQGFPTWSSRRVQRSFTDVGYPR